MNRFYIEEGNKRVSVLKCAGAFSIAGEVTRIMPVRSGEKANRLYFEFVDFYRLSELNSIFFSQEGGYAALQKALGKRPNEIWSEDDRRDFNFLYLRFCMAYGNAAKAPDGGGRRATLSCVS